MTSQFSNKPKIGVLYICTGKYSAFWDDFYSSTKSKLFNDSELMFYVFTDDESILKSEHNDVTTVYCQSEAWPFPTLMRYRTFLSIEHKYQDVEYLLFCNANLRVTSPVQFDEVFGVQDLFATIHPGYEGKNASTFPYEKNIKSRAHTDKRALEYVCGGFNGGRRDPFLSMCYILNGRIQKDFSENIIAIWHDETHFNRYYAENREKFNLISADFCFPEGWDLERKSKITILTKENYIGVMNKGFVYALRYYASKINNKLKLMLNLIRLNSGNR